ncbi:MAG: hypothetical protein BWY15_02423 [Firmicutes bacterium ADurb.Bin193]|nr:MAG: hypothetical protein BWY15_02423 [Firmicutes bacterium ADurb.Bin193]
MFRKKSALVSVLIILVFAMSTMAVFAEDEKPELIVTLNSDGSSSMMFVAKLDPEEIDSTIAYYNQLFFAENYTVEKSEDGSSMVITNNFPVDKGYNVDLTVLGGGEESFVSFEELFVNRYGFKNTTFNAEERPAGTEYFKITIITPVRASKSNADTQEDGGKKHTWVISSGRKNIMTLSFKTYNMVPLISALFGIVLLAVLIYLIATDKKKNKDYSYVSDESLSEDEEITEEPQDEEIEEMIEQLDFEVDSSNGESDSGDEDEDNQEEE